MRTLASNAESSPQRGRVIVWLAVAVLTPAFYCMEHRNASVPNLDAFRLSGEEMAARAAEGDPARRIAIPALGLFGVFLLMRPQGYRLEVRSPLAWLLVGYVAWVVISIAWSIDLPVTVRHVVVFLLCTAAAVGLARQCSLHELWVITLAVTSLLVANSIRTELALGTFRPWAPDYRFAGNLHPNVQAPYCAAMALSAGYLASQARRGRMLLWATCAVAAALLILTKSRSVCGAVLAALLVYGWFGSTWEKRALAGAGLLAFACCLAFTGTLLGWDVDQQATSVALLGRQEETDSLSGRLPFWSQLLPHVLDRALLGHGYRTYWNPQRIGDFSQSLEWTVTDGHSAYLDTLLDLGLVGGLLFSAAIGVGLVAAAARYRAANEVAVGILFVLLLCRALNALLESAFLTPTNFVSFVVMWGLAHLAFCRSASPVPGHVAAAIRESASWPRPLFVRIPQTKGGA